MDATARMLSRTLDLNAACERVVFLLPTGEFGERCARVAGGVAAPCHMMIGADEHKICTIEVARFIAGNIEHGERYTKCGRRIDIRSGFRRMPAEPRECKSLAKAIENRYAVVDP